MIEQGTHPGKVCFASSGTMSATAHWRSSPTHLWAGVVEPCAPALAIIHSNKEQGQPMQTDTRPKPEPLHIRKERQVAEGQAAWTKYRAEQDAVNKNMERLRALRLAREAAPAPDAKGRAPKRA
jgi:hypothetical protein